MIINLGGGTPLNFDVVGGTSQPTRPKENTVWVNTNEEVTSWEFSTDEPENPTNGMVWIKTGVVAATPFNALKKNDIQVFPIGAAQYISGAWATKECKIYQDSKYRDVGVYIYDLGVQYYSLGTSGYTRDTAINYATRGSLSFNEDHIYMYCDEVSGGNGGIRFFGTDEKVDLTGCSTLYVELENYVNTDNEGSNRLRISASPTKQCPGTTTGGATMNVANGTTVATLDVSNISSAYIVITITVWNGGESVKANIKRIYAR
jgi:hypothetical protein